MKRKLNRKMFNSGSELVNFINKEQIKQEDIQKINFDMFCYILFYWEEVEEWI